MNKSIREGGAFSVFLFACIYLIVLVVLGMFLAITIEAADTMTLKNAAVILTFLINAVLAVVFLLREMCRRSFSLQLTHWVFYLTLFVMAPYSQHVFDYNVWGVPLSESALISTNLLLTAWGLVFGFASRSKGSPAACGSAPVRYVSFFRSIPRISRSAVILSLCLSFFALVFLIRTVGFSDLFSRSTFSLDFGQTANLVIDKVLRGVPVFTAVFALVRLRQSGKGRIALLLSLAFLLVADFPASMARYNAAAVYGCLIILSFPKLFEKKGLYPLLLLAALLLVFPAVNVFRTDEFSLALLLSGFVDVALNLPRGFCAGDYDAYSMLARSVVYVGSYGASMGSQLLTAILFFVPRAFWSAKGIGSGALIARTQDQDFENISCPLPAEGVMNFGIIGLFLFALVMGMLCKRIDEGFWFGESSLRLFYPFFCVIFFFVMRGDLLSSFAYLAGYFAVYVALLKVVEFISDFRASRSDV